jgi:hypothetical protein
MPSSDYRQITSLLQRLGGALNPIQLVAGLAELVTEVATPPPGDPDALDAAAAAYRTAAAAIPEPAFTDAADALTELAASIREQQATHAELHRALRAAAYDATHVGSVPMPDPTALDDLARAAAALVRGCVQVYTASLDAADRAASRFTDIAGRARLAAAVSGGLPVELAVRLTAQMVSVLGDGYDDGILTLAQLRRVGRLTSPEFAELLDRAGSDQERAWLAKALTAGHDPAALTAFADRIRGQEPAWLDAHLSLIDRGGTGAQLRLGVDVRQYEDTTCGTTSLIVTRAEADPVYALRLTVGDFPAAFKAERDLVHHQTNVLWPEPFGTSPAGMAGYLNDHANVTGIEYTWHLVDDTDPRAISAALREVLMAADRGHPAPVLVGDLVSRHYVLVVGHSGGDVLLYEPTGGATVRVPQDAFLSGRLKDLTGFDHVQAVVVPQAGQPLAAGRGLDGSK